jgi:hypothetical protein
MNNIKNLVNRLVEEFTTNDKRRIDFEHDVQMAEMHPGGKEKYFIELRFEHYKKIDQNVIGNIWVEMKRIDPFSKMKNSDEIWIEYVVNSWLKKYDTKNDSDLIDGLDFAARLEITVFLREYFHIQQINNYLDSLRKTEDSNTAIQEATHEDNKRKGLSHPEIALICHYIGIPVDSKTAPTILKQFNNDLKSHKKLDNEADRFVRKLDRINLTGNKSADSKRIGTQERVIKYLKENGHNFTEAESDLKELEKIYNQTYN